MICSTLLPNKRIYVMYMFIPEVECVVRRAPFLILTAWVTVPDHEYTFPNSNPITLITYVCLIYINTYIS